MNKRLLFAFLACFTAVGLLTACGNTVQEQNESTTPQSSTVLQETQESMENTEPTETTSPIKVEVEIITDRSDDAPQEQPKKNFIETIVETVTGWFSGETSKEENKTETTTPVTPPGNESQGATEPTYENTDTTEDTEPSVEETTQEPTEGGVLTYEQYLALSPEDRLAYYETFDTPDAFILWFNAAQKEYNDKYYTDPEDSPLQVSP